MCTEVYDTNTFLCVCEQGVYSEVMKHKSELDRVRDKGDAIVQRSSDPRVSNNMMQLYTKYQALSTAAKVREIEAFVFGK